MNEAVAFLCYGYDPITFKVTHDLVMRVILSTLGAKTLLSPEGGAT